MTPSAALREISRQEVEQRGGKDTLFVIDNVVYDVTVFLDEHPGGHEVLQQMAGKDASEEFHDVGHSLDARELMARYAVGRVPTNEERATSSGGRWVPPSTSTQPESAGLPSWSLPLALGLLLTLAYTYLFT